jgi:hypothetical protein
MSVRVVRTMPALALAMLVTGTAGVRADDLRAPVVRTHVDRTASWVADRITYVVEIVCPKGVDILGDDVAKEKLKTVGLDVVNTETTEVTSANEVTTHRIAYTLTTYHVDTPGLRVEPLSVRYFVKRPGQRLQDAAPAGDIVVPAQSIAFRSTLPDDVTAAALRDRKPPAPRARRYTAARAVGIALMLISIAPLAFFAVAAVGRRRPRREGKSTRQIRHEEKLTLESLQAMDIATEDGRRRAYDTIDSLVRAHLRDVVGIAGPSLTPAEVTPAFGERRTRVEPGTVAALLATCEQARYAPAAALPGQDACRDAIAQAEQVLAAR